MRLIYIYTRDGRIPMEHVMADGRIWLLGQMVKQKIVDRCLLVIEGSQLPAKSLAPGFDYISTTDVNSLAVNPSEDIVWVRGGFKPTLFYNRMVKEKVWLLFYGANTGRARWSFWDVVFDDLTGKDFFSAEDRLWLNYPKPIHPEVFKPMGLKNEYDLCIGASFIHDKKGQWQGVKIAMAYKELFGKHLHCVMPGTLRGGGVRSRGIKADIEKHGLIIHTPGYISRAKLAALFNRSRLFLHCGSGQNDRGVLEALRCGTPCVVTQPNRHAPFIYQNSDLGKAVVPADNYLVAATYIHLRLSAGFNRAVVHDFYEKYAGIESAILPILSRLFSFFRRYPVVDKEALKREYSEL